MTTCSNLGIIVNLREAIIYNPTEQLLRVNLTANSLPVDVLGEICIEPLICLRNEREMPVHKLCNLLSPLEQKTAFRNIVRDVTKVFGHEVRTALFIFEDTLHAPQAAVAFSKAEHGDYQWYGNLVTKETYTE
ncbi:MAG: hypothetical protein Q4B34_01740 [Candidatus Saccharibacteria bacterium]|nr:hypothetical protein [Candidatus Saccharibacteria bacterium]